MRTRRATPADHAALQSVFVEAIQVTAAAHYDAAQRDAWSGRAGGGSWGERLYGLETLLAEDDDGPLGFLSFAWSGYVDFLYTAPRAARRGVASALWAEAEAVLRGRGVTEATTHASLSARPFFASRGFEVVEREIVQVGGIELERYRMRKGLGAEG